MQLGLRATAALTYYRSETVAVPHRVFRAAVQDTAQYDQFVPWCKRSIVTPISPLENHTQLTISFHDLGEISYNSHVRIAEQPNRCTITSLCTDHPLRRLQSVWDIAAEGEHSAKVSYSLDFEFSSLLYQLTSRAFLNFMGQNMWDTFVARAKTVHKQTQPAETAATQPKSPQPLSDEQYDADYCLYKYLLGRPELQKMMQKDPLFAQEVSALSLRLAGTNSF